MTVSVKPMFLDGEKGQIFALHFCPKFPPRAHLVFLPPFGEEMNRCRHLVADQAKRFACDGYSCLILDPYGTGDSEGELADASWKGWRADAMTGVRWCQKQQLIPVILWGLRLGALLALDLASTHTGQFGKLLLWQPVTNGKTYLTQVLRARIAYLSANNLPQETTENMRFNMQRGASIEVAGYVLGGKLAEEIDSVNVTNFLSLAAVHIYWLHQTTRPDYPIPVGMQKAVDQLLSQNNAVEITLFQTPQIWQLSERADCQQLIEKTSALQLL